MRSSVRVLAISLLLLFAVPTLARGGDEDDPHVKMLRSKAVCVDCHTRVPKADEHAADYFLVDAPSEHCLGCHDETAHPGAREHLGTDAATHVADEHGKIACFTCHDPHPSGVLPGRTVHPSAATASTRAFIAARTWPPPLERREPSEIGALLRIPDCATCHPSTQDPSWKERATWSEAIRVLPR